MGHFLPRDLRIPNVGHGFTEVTSEPADTILAGRPVNVLIEHAVQVDPADEIDVPTADVPDVAGKPAYRVPSMAEICALEPNGFTAASTFSGCGGSSLGYRMAGFRMAYANEFVEAARDTYRANAAEYTIVDGRDIRTVTGADVLQQIGLKRGELDLLDGSPPCASFSTAGKRDKGWGIEKKYSDTVQRSDDLFFEFARLLEEIQPRTFVAENVSGLVKGTAKGYFKLILARLRGAGYKVSARVLDASWLGVPQARRRLIFVGVRNDLELEPVHPLPLPYQYSVRDALESLAAEEFALVHDTSGAWGMGDVTDRPSPTITVGVNAVNANHFKLIVRPPYAGGGVAEADLDVPSPTVMAHGLGGVHYGQVGMVTPEPVTHDPETGQEITLKRYAIGREWEKLEPGGKSDKYLSLIRPKVGRPYPTVTATAGGVGAAGPTHWAEARKLTLRELRSLGGFPLDFELTGTYAQRWERIGRAVPPVMMQAVAATVRDEILGPLRAAGRI